MIDAARVLQARALAQLGETEAAGALFEEIAMESPGSESLGEYGRHLLRSGRPEEALEKLVDALAYEGYGYRGAAEEAAKGVGLPNDAVETRLAARRPVVQAEKDRMRSANVWDAPLPISYSPIGTVPSGGSAI